MLNAERFDASSMILRASAALAATLAVCSPAQPPAANAAARATALDPARCAQAKLTPDARNMRAMRAATLCLVNQERVLHGELPLRIDRPLQRSAQSHTQSMVAENYFAHIGPHDDTLLRRDTCERLFAGPAAQIRGRGEHRLRDAPAVDPVCDRASLDSFAATFGEHPRQPFPGHRHRRGRQGTGVRLRRSDGRHLHTGLRLRSQRRGLSDAAAAFPPEGPDR